MRQATSAVEVMVAVMVAAAIGIPCLQLLFAERDTEQRSRYEYVALLAARDEMYQARMLAALGATPESLAHDFRALEGNPLDGLGQAFIGNKTCSPYYPEQKRISTSLNVDPPLAGNTPRIQLATLTARWLDPSQDPAARGGSQKTTVDVVFGVLKPGP
jgi:hypothetical protein